MNILIPMAGKGTRFIKAGYSLPKPLINVKGKPMIKAVLDSMNLYGNFFFITREYQDENNNKKLEKILLEHDNKSKIISINEVTRGAAETCLLAEKLINDEQPLIITNCDQIFQHDISDFINFAKRENADGAVTVFKSKDPRYSFIKVDSNNIGTCLAEKNPISNLALTGLHYWKNGSDFVRSVKKMIKQNELHKNEFYIAPSYNYLISEGKKIIPVLVDRSDTKIIGTPEELEEYLNAE